MCGWAGGDRAGHSSNPIGPSPFLVERYLPPSGPPTHKAFVPGDRPREYAAFLVQGWNPTSFAATDPSPWKAAPTGGRSASHERLHGQGCSSGFQPGPALCFYTSTPGRCGGRRGPPAPSGSGWSAPPSPHGRPSEIPAAANAPNWLARVRQTRCPFGET